MRKQALLGTNRYGPYLRRAEEAGMLRIFDRFHILAKQFVLRTATCDFLSNTLKHHQSTQPLSLPLLSKPSAQPLILCLTMPLITDSLDSLPCTFPHSPPLSTQVTNHPSPQISIIPLPNPSPPPARSSPPPSLPPQLPPPTPLSHHHPPPC